MKSKLITSKAKFILDNVGFGGEIDFCINDEGIAEMKRQIEAEGRCADRAAMDKYYVDVVEHMHIKEEPRFEQSYFIGHRLKIWWIELDSDKHFDCFFYATQEEINNLFEQAKKNQEAKINKIKVEKIEAHNNSIKLAREAALAININNDYIINDAGSIQLGEKIKSEIENITNGNKLINYAHLYGAIQSRIAEKIRSVK